MTKKIWITGASSGIGRALAIKFSKEGWQVAASARRENLLNDLNKNNTNLPLLKSDTDNVIEYNTDFSIKKDKPKRRFWKLMSNE